MTLKERLEMQWEGPIADPCRRIGWRADDLTGDLNPIRGRLVEAPINRVWIAKAHKIGDAYRAGLYLPVTTR